MINRKKTIFGYVLVLLFIFFTWPLFNTFWASYISINLSPNEFGDVFGGLNALFTGLAFLGLVNSLIDQRKDLEELKNQNQMSADSNALKLYETVFSQKMVELKDIFDYHNAKTIDPEIIPNSISSITEEKINIWIKREEKTEPFCIKDLECFIDGEKIRAGSEFTPHSIRDKIRTLQRKKSEWYGNKIVEDAKRKLEEETSEFNKLDSPDAKQIADLELTKSNHDWWGHIEAPPI